MDRAFSTARPGGSVVASTAQIPRVGSKGRHQHRSYRLFGEQAASPDAFATINLVFWLPRTILASDPGGPTYASHLHESDGRPGLAQAIIG